MLCLIGVYPKKYGFISVMVVWVIASVTFLGNPDMVLRGTASVELEDALVRQMLIATALGLV